MVNAACSAICQIERGSRSVSFGLACEIADALGCDIKDFMAKGDE